MKKDLVYNLDIITAKCFICKEEFKLYSVQKMGMNFCKMCSSNNKLTELTTLPNILTKITRFAEQANEKIDGRLVVDISSLFIDLQENNE